MTQFLRALVTSGADPADFVYLADVVTREKMRAGFMEDMNEL
ncbi:hypothetical protein [Sulfitobacter sp. MF3-043]